MMTMPLANLLHYHFVPKRSRIIHCHESFLILLAALLLASLIVSSAAGPLSISAGTGNSITDDPMRVAIITGGTRGIGRGITDAVLETGEFRGFILVYNTNRDAAENYCEELKDRVFGETRNTDANCNSADESRLKIRLVGGDISLESTRDKVFECFDKEFAANGENEEGCNKCEAELALMVHNAGQYVGVTSDNSHGISKPDQTKKFGDGSLLTTGENGRDKVDMSYMNFYHKLYGEAFIDLCERSLKRMKDAYSRHENSKGSSFRGSIIGISSPGCNAAYSMTPGYDMPGSGKCLMEFSIRHYALSAAQYGINCNIIIPGVTRSDAWDKVAEQQGLSDKEAIFARSKGMIPMGDVAEAKDIGDVVAFLSGHGGGKFMTGLSLRVDGGLHLSRMGVGKPKQ
mmetsp:Transcript_4185/g.8668  ORF Transcript_4185/g.8668 Transcript_4185/m.8668 type:complete len:402 (+) Transcript_4185:108-1313(+)